MSKISSFFKICAILFLCLFHSQLRANEPDSAYIFAYATVKNYNHNGLHFAWSIDKENWHAIGPEHSYLKCDYGRWGSEKRMLRPDLICDKNGVWHCIWGVNERDGVLAHAASPDLVNWGRQSYPVVVEGKNAGTPEVSHGVSNNFAVSWLSNNKIHISTTNNFKEYATAQEKNEEFYRINKRDAISINGTDEVGTVHKVKWSIIKGLISAQQMVGEEKDYVAYLFAYFTGNRVEEEAVHYAISADGYNYLALNNNQPVLNSKQISSTGGVRDPHILRGVDGKTFYMVLTDMTSSKGWDSNRAMVLLKSTDLINWTSTVVNIQKKYNNQENLKRVWAPQTIYDPAVDKYMVYWSMKHGNGADIIYYAYANADFTDFEGEPKQLFFPENGRSCIDGDIVFKDSTFYMFYKTEGHGNGLKLATTKLLTSGKWTEYEDYKQQTTDAVEGSSLFKLINTDTYILMYDVYMKGKYQFTESKDLENFKVIDNDISMNFHPRHGSIIPITRAELNALTQKWGVPQGFHQ